jgi:hypothetical protein
VDGGKERAKERKSERVSRSRAIKVWEGEEAEMYKIIK